MRISCSPSWAVGPLGLSVAALLLLSSPLMSERARAYGGLWSSEAAPVEHTATEVLFVDNPDSTLTAVVQVEYAGPAESFAWLIPVPGKPTVAISSRTVFDRLEAATAPQYWVDVAVEGTCLPEEDQDAALAPDAGARVGDEPGVVDAGASPVDVMEQSTLGPYDYVTLEVDPSLADPAELVTDWLTTNGYDISGVDVDVLRSYLKQGLNLLAFKLTSGADVGAIRPVSLTYEGKRPIIPLRASAAAAQDDLGLQVWVIGPSQAVPVNYASLVLNDARIDWSSGQTFVRGTPPAGGAGPFGPLGSRPSNYDAVVSAAADEADGQGFVTELGGPASQYRDALWSSLDEMSYASITAQSYADGIDAVLAAQARYGLWDGWREAVASASSLPDDVTLDDFVRAPDAYRGVVEVDASELLRLLDERVVGPVADAGALFYRGPYLTRLYTTISPREMMVDPVFDYNPELAQVDNIHIARQRIQCSSMLRKADAPWRMELPQGGVVVGEGHGGWPVAEDSMPANLAIVELSTNGSGKVVEDNREEIGATLFELAGMQSTWTLEPPQHGVPIGGAQTVLRYEEPAPMQESASGDAGCRVARVAAGTGHARAPWWLLGGATVALGRRGRRRWEAS